MHLLDLTFVDGTSAYGSSDDSTDSEVYDQNELQCRDAIGTLQIQASQKVTNAFKASEARQGTKAPQRRDRSDRATVEQAIDPRTRKILFKLLNGGVFTELHGCVSTGKEANVYYAANTVSGLDLAVKVYKTSILVFKDRDRYVRGDTRFSSKYSKGNPRKMVATWAEKEQRNLYRLAAAGVPCPLPCVRRKHVLIMDFVGEKGVAAPRLKDAFLSESQLRTCYRELLRLMWVMWFKARLVHADLSEYNILVHKGELVIIDVSQSVDLDHPLALDFLREDCLHVNDFFRRAGVSTLSMRQAFEFIIDPAVTAENVEQVLDRLSEAVCHRPVQQSDAERIDDAVYREAFIPRKLNHVVEYEREHDRVVAQGNSGSSQDTLHFQLLSGMKMDMSGPRERPLVLERLAGSNKAEDVERKEAAIALCRSNDTCSAATVSGATQSSDMYTCGQDLEPLAGTPAHEGERPATASEQCSSPSGNHMSVSPSAAATDAPQSALEALCTARCQGTEGEPQGLLGSPGGDPGSPGSETDSNSETSSCESGDGGAVWEERAAAQIDPEEVKAQRKAHKKAVKEENREKRRHKLPKHLKKQAAKRSAAKKK